MMLCEFLSIVNKRFQVINSLLFIHQKYMYILLQTFIYNKSYVIKHFWVFIFFSSIESNVCIVMWRLERVGGIHVVLVSFSDL